MVLHAPYLQTLDPPLFDVRYAVDKIANNFRRCTRCSEKGRCTTRYLSRSQGERDLGTLFFFFFFFLYESLMHRKGMHTGLTDSTCANDESLTRKERKLILVII